MRQRSKRRSFANVKDLCTPDSSISLRTILDRVADGKPCNARVRQHEPLPPDGMNMDDFDTGTMEVLDLTDAQAIADEMREKIAQAAKNAADEKAKKDKETLQALVDAEIAKRQQEITT